MNKKKTAIILFLSCVLMCSGCNNYTLEDYATYDVNSSAVEERGMLIKESYDTYTAGGIVLIEECGVQGTMKVRPGYVNVTVTDVKVCKAENNDEYLQYINENALFKEWVINRVVYDVEKNMFVSQFSDVGANVFMIKMELSNPTDIEQEVSFCSLKLLERDKETGSFRRLNIFEDYLYEPKEKSQSISSYIMAPGETFNTTLWCIMPSERVLEYYFQVYNDEGQIILGKSEEYSKDSIYLHLNTKGSSRVIQENDNFVKIKFPEDY